MVTHAGAELIHSLLKPTPASPLTVLGDKQTFFLKQLVEIFTKAAPP